MRRYIFKTVLFLLVLVSITTIYIIFKILSTTPAHRSEFSSKNNFQNKTVVGHDFPKEIAFNNFIFPEFINKIQVKSYQNSESIKKTIENLPYSYFQNKNKLPYKQFYNKTCAQFPKFFDIKFTSDHWQTQKANNGTLQLFNAYYDYRNITNNKTAVRVISMYDKYYSNDTFYCQFWYENLLRPVITKSEQLIWIWNKKWGGNLTEYHPYIITCVLPKNSIPTSVSVVEKPCENATNNLRVKFKKVREEEKKNFLVCVKGLDFPFEDRSIRLVEWIELLFILGADKINFYKYHVHPNIEKVLDHYSRFANVEVTPISLIDGASNSPYLQSIYLRNHFHEQVFPEAIAFNDCLYKHLEEYKFVVILDTDEVIVPTNGSTWLELIQKSKKSVETSYIARNVYFLDSHGHNHGWFDGIPKFFHMLQHVYRAENYTRRTDYVKGFHDTNKMVALHNHFPIRCVGRCANLFIDLDNGHLQHYRSDCSKDRSNNCQLMRTHSVLDTRLWNYKNVLIERALQVLLNLDLVDVPNSF